MAAPSRFKEVFGSAGTALDTGIVKSDPSRPIIQKIEEFRQGAWARTIVTMNAWSYACTSDAAEAFGQHIYTFPEGFIVPIRGFLKVTSTTPTGLSATAGEFGLGTLVGSGANATVGAVGATAEDIMEGTTISNHVAGTALTSNKTNTPLKFGDHGATTAVDVLDGSGTAKKVYFNVASTWNQTAAESITFNSVVAQFDWYYLGDV